MSFAIIQTGGKQYKIASGDVLAIEKLPEPSKGGELVFDQVLLVDDGKTTTIGDPFIKGASIKAEFMETGKSKKITAVKFKNKTRYKKLIGHRQPFTRIKIKEVK